MKTILFITCGNKKLPYSAKAKEIYCSSVFKSYYKFGIDNFDEVAILSSKHNLLNPEDIIEPYDVYIGNFSDEELKQWSIKTKKLIIERYPRDEYEYYFLTGKLWTKYIDIPNMNIILEGKDMMQKMSFIKQSKLICRQGYSIGEFV